MIRLGQIGAEDLLTGKGLLGVIPGGACLPEALMVSLALFIFQGQLVIFQSLPVGFQLGLALTELLGLVPEANKLLQGGFQLPATGLGLGQKTGVSVQTATIFQFPQLLGQGLCGAVFFTGGYQGIEPSA